MFFGEDWVPDYAFLHDRYEAQQERDLRLLSEDESDDDIDEDEE